MILWHVLLCYVILCRAPLCCVILCCVIRCCVIPCCVVLPCVMSYSHVIMKSCSRDIQLSCPLVIMLRLSCSVVNIDGLRPSASHSFGSLDFSLACSWALSLALLLFYSLPLPHCDFVPLRPWSHAIRLSCYRVLMFSSPHALMLSCSHPPIRS